MHRLGSIYEQIPKVIRLETEISLLLASLLADDGPIFCDFEGYYECPFAQDDSDYDDWSIVMAESYDPAVDHSSLSREFFYVLDINDIIYIYIYIYIYIQTTHAITKSGSTK